jgi:hypothetical protein
MRSMGRMAALAAVVVGLVVGAGVTGAAAGDEVTLQGKVVCAKCTMNRADAKECQNVLVVAGADDKDVEYYIAKNEVSTKFGEVCTDTTKATVTGTVSEKQGRKWITASKMEGARAAAPPPSSR